MLEIYPPSILPGVAETGTHNVFALQRSGHHAVMGWLQDCYERAGKSTTHVNDVYHGHIPGIDVADPSAEDILSHSASSNVAFVNYEDLGYQARWTAPNYVGLQATPYRAQLPDVVVLRDWYNMAASRLQSIDKAKRTGIKLQLHDLPWTNLIKVWEEHAGLSVSGTGPVVINYNHWFTSQKYREATAGQFGLINSDATLDQVPTFGRGSSFDGMAYTGSGRQMGVLERWKCLPGEQLAFLIEVTESSATLNALHTHIFGFGQKQVKQHMPQSV